jgi:hypothetical protein
MTAAIATVSGRDFRRVSQWRPASTLTSNGCGQAQAHAKRELRTLRAASA